MRPLYGEWPRHLETEFPPLRGIRWGSYVGLTQHLGRRLIELLRAPHFLEARDQILWPHPLFLRTAEVMQDLALVDHDQAISERRRLVHGMGHHERCQAIARDHL